MPEPIQKIIQELDLKMEKDTDGQYNNQGMKLLQKCLQTEIQNPCLNVGRLLLLQCPRKIRKYGSKYPSFKTTRPISITSVYQKINEHILLARIKDQIIVSTSPDNAGFKPWFNCLCPGRWS